MFSSSFRSSNHSELAELVRYSAQTALRRSSLRRSPRIYGEKPSLSSENWWTKSPEPESSSALLTSFSQAQAIHAMPLMPLRERDMKALAVLFEHREIEEIESDVLANLVHLHPEPCWDEDPFERLPGGSFDFLKDYL